MQSITKKNQKQVRRHIKKSYAYLNCPLCKKPIRLPYPNIIFIPADLCKCSVHNNIEDLY